MRLLLVVGSQSAGSADPLAFAFGQAVAQVATGLFCMNGQCIGELCVGVVCDDPPATACDGGSLAELITAMRDQDVVPPHEANMMHTIRSLRNLVVHENVVFGKHETAIARAAWQIVRDWAEQHEDEVWHLTMAVCRTAA